jgi:hypothetical protein
LRVRQYVGERKALGFLVILVRVEEESPVSSVIEFRDDDRAADGAAPVVAAVAGPVLAPSGVKVKGRAAFRSSLTKYSNAVP